MPSGPDIGYGMSVTHAELPTEYNIISLSRSGAERPVVFAPHIATTGAGPKFPVGYFNAGTVSIEVQWDVGTPLAAGGTANADQDLTSAAADMTITFPIIDGGSTAATAVASAILQAIEGPNFEAEGIVTGTFTFELAADFTYTDGT